MKKKHPFGSENLAVATLNLHGVSLPNVYQQHGFLLTKSIELNFSTKKNTTVFGWRKKKMFGVKNKKSKTLREAENSKSAISRLTNVSLRPRFRCWLDILRNVQRAMPAARAAFIPAVVL